jgi:2,3-bisphosphoglycerate-independent phosphoglycerate mutase
MSRREREREILCSSMPFAKKGGAVDNCNGVETRVAFVLIHGLGDVSITSLNFQRPLKSAVPPNSDAIACADINGSTDPLESGLACGSDTAHLSLLGYHPRIYYRGRGAFESMGVGLAMSPGDIAFCKVRLPSMQRKL